MTVDIIPAMAVQFLTWWFRKTDIIQFEPLVMVEPTEQDKRRVKPVYDLRQYFQMGVLQQAYQQEPRWIDYSDEQLNSMVTAYLHRVTAKRAHAFFSVSPRELPDRQADMLHQIRTMLGCWADFDNTTPDAVLAHINAVGVPEPSCVVSSGRGVHCYWKFDQPYLVNDAGPVIPVFYDKPPGEEYRKPYVKLADGSKDWLGNRRIKPSEQCQAFIDVQAGLYTMLTNEKVKVTADSVQNPNRFLRIVGSVNPKNNALCHVVGYSSSVVSFKQMYELTLAAQPKTTKTLDLVPEPKKRKFASLRDSKRNRITDLTIALETTPVGQRSDKAFELVCLCHEAGIAYDECMSMMMRVAVFQEKGEKWFDITWEAAVNKHKSDYIARSEMARVQLSNREGLGPVPTATPASPDDPQEEKVDPATYWQQAKINRAKQVCRMLECDVVGEKADGSIVIYSSSLGKTTEIKDIGRVQVARVMQALGTPAVTKVSPYESDSPNQVSISELREIFGYLAGQRQITADTYIGTGIWPVRDKGTLTGEYALVAGAGSAIYDSHTRKLFYPNSPRYKDVVMSLEGQVEQPWFDLKELQTAIDLAADPDNRKLLLDRINDHFSQWQWANAATSPVILTGLALAAFVQTVWDWRPLVAFTGATKAGKSLLLGQLEKLYGPLAFSAAHPTEAGIRQGLQNTARIIISDEFEASSRRQMVYELFRTSSRGDKAIRGSAGGRAQSYGLKHIPFVAAIELGMSNAPDRNRFIVLELENTGDTFQVWTPENGARARLACLGAVLYSLPRALELIQVIVNSQVAAGTDRRLADNLAVPIAMALAVQGVDASAAVDAFARVMATFVVENDHDGDDRELLGAILRLQLDTGHKSANLTIGEVLSDLAQRHSALDMMARLYGVTVIEMDRGQGKPRPITQVPEERRALFIAGKRLKESNALRFSGFAEQNANEILKRICPGATSTRARVAGSNVHGVAIPLSWVSEHLLGS